MPLRALFFVETPHRLAGAQRSLMAALSRIDAHGVGAVAVFPAAGIVEEAYRHAGIATRIEPAPPAYLAFNKRILGLGVVEKARVVATELLPYSLHLAHIARGFDVMHFNTPRGILSAGAAAKLARKPAVLHLRGAAEGFGDKLWLAAQALADRIILVARALETNVAARFRPKCTVVYNGVDVPPAPDRRAARAALFARLGVEDGGEPVFVSLSSYTPFKGLHHLVAAHPPGARLVLAGGGGDEAYEAYLRRRVTSDRVHLLGFVPDPLAVLAGADALVLPSVDRETLTLDDGRVLDVRGTEGLPRSILEAMALGVPVVATRVQGVVEQVEDGVTGIVVPPGDVAAFRAAMERVAADAAWRERAGARARAIVERKFTVDAAARGLADVLAATVERRWPPSRASAG